MIRSQLVSNLLINPITLPETGLVGWWRMEEPTAIDGTKIMDSSGYGNHGTLSTGDGSVNKSVAGKLGKGLSFDGNDYVSTVSNAGFSGTGSRTVSLWFNPGTKQGAQILFQTGTNGFGNKFIIGYDWVVNEGIYFDTYGQNDTNGKVNSITRGSWNHVVIVFTYGVSSSIYINGVLDATDNKTTLTNISATTITIGGTDGYFNGLIDDVRIYNRALTAGEVRELFENTQRITTPMIVPKIQIPAISNYYKHLRT